MIEDTPTQKHPRPGNSSSGAWLVWDRMPQQLREPSHKLIGFARRLNAHTTKLPSGTPPPLPASAVDLRTLHGGFWFDDDDRKVTTWIRRQATWEQDVIRCLAWAVRPGMTAVDVGANVGFLAVQLSRFVGPTGRVHAFEPHPVTLELLRANLWRHRCANTTVHPCAASEHAGRVELVADPEGLSGVHMGSGGISVEAVTLDEALGGTPVDFMKIDVEGAEPMVLRGARATIAASRRVVAVAEFRGYDHLDGSSPDETLDLYESLGFTVSLLRADGRPVDASRAAVLEAARRVDTLNVILQKS
ncbi:MAG TPA: FkbM family methyltransferase [Gaiellaceae bacterium]|nr:FkbM family methyltransferase [Gaiellaceae bacterium]